MTHGKTAAILVVSGALLLLAGASAGSAGWSSPWPADDAALRIVGEIRMPRSLGAWLTGALLGLAGAIAQGLFRNPLADPYLLGSSSGAALGVASWLALAGAGGAAWTARVGATGAAFAGAMTGVMLTLVLARGVQHTLRLLLAGVVVGVVLGALVSVLSIASPGIAVAMQSYLLGTTSYLGWESVAMLAVALVPCLGVAAAGARSLDALTLGEATASSLGVRMPQLRFWLVAALALATGCAVAQAGMVAFVGLVAPHLVRGVCRPTHAALAWLSALAGGALLLAADVIGRAALAPAELPVGVLTAVLGGGYLLWLMRHARLGATR